MDAVEEAKRFLEHLKGLTEIQTEPDVFKGSTLDRNGTRLMFWAGTGQYTTLLTAKPDGVQVVMLQDGVTYRIWEALPDGRWCETQTGQSGPNFDRERFEIATNLIKTVGSRLPVS